MPWSNQDGGGWSGGGSGGGGGRGPWGQGPRGGGPQGPNLEDLLKRGQDRLKSGMPGGIFRGWGLIIAIIVAIGAWVATGIYTVQPDEQGVVLRFGKWTSTTHPGWHYHLPTPIESVLKPKVTRVNRITVGFLDNDNRDRGRRQEFSNLKEEAHMLTGDENIIDINFTVFWRIGDAGKFLFNIDRPEVTVKAVAESVMREVIGKTAIQTALTAGRRPIETATQEQMQKVLDEYGAGVLVTQVKLQKVDPPAEVIASFRDVQAAKADQERQKNEAEAYANDIIPRARGETEKMLQEAEAYRQQQIAEAEGEAQRFLSVYREFRNAKGVTSRRLYLETMEQVFNGMNKVIIDSQGGSPGVVPYLPLPELQKQRGTN